MLVREYMTRDLVTIEPEARLSDALNMMRARNVHRLPAVSYTHLTLPTIYSV